MRYRRILNLHSPTMIEMIPSNCYGGLDGWVVLVIHDLEIIVTIIKDRFGVCAGC